MSHAWATVCIQVPTREIICPPKKSWKLRCFNARKAPAARPRLGALGAGALVDVTSTSVEVGFGAESAISRKATMYCNKRAGNSRTATHGCPGFATFNPPRNDHQSR